MKDAVDVFIEQKMWYMLEAKTFSLRLFRKVVNFVDKM